MRPLVQQHPTKVEVVGYAFLCHDSVIQACLMTLAAPSVVRPLGAIDNRSTLYGNTSLIGFHFFIGHHQSRFHPDAAGEATIWMTPAGDAATGFYVLEAK